MSFSSLPTGKLYKKKGKKKLKNFPAGYVGRFYGNLAENNDNFLGSDFYRRITLLMIMRYLLLMYRNIFLPPVTLWRAFKLTLTIMWQKTGSTTLALDRS